MNNIELINNHKIIITFPVLDLIQIMYLRLHLHLTIQVPILHKF
jgi:hypothetical protein